MGVSVSRLEHSNVHLQNHETHSFDLMLGTAVFGEMKVVLSTDHGGFLPHDHALLHLIADAMVFAVHTAGSASEVKEPLRTAAGSSGPAGP